MSQIRFDAASVAGLRFYISPMWETVRSLYVLADPGRHSLHLQWARQARELPDPALLRAFARPGVWMPDFLTPPPPGPFAEFADELATVAATPPEVIVADLAATTARSPLSAPAQALADEPERFLPDLIAAIEAWHDAAIAPHWPRMRALLEADVSYRSRQLAEGGPRLLLDTLHSTVRWAADRLICDDPFDLDLDLRGRGLPLMPSVFVDRWVLWNVRQDSPPMGIYPARATGTLWQARPAGDQGLAAALGATRALLLVMLQNPATTTELARRVELSPAAVSQHLHALHAAGLVTRTQHGRSVLYFITHPAAVLLRANALMD